jgi:hypothetical protein
MLPAAGISQQPSHASAARSLAQQRLPCSATPAPLLPYPRVPHAGQGSATERLLAECAGAVCCCRGARYYGCAQEARASRSGRRRQQARARRAGSTCTGALPSPALDAGRIREPVPRGERLPVSSGWLQYDQRDRRCFRGGCYCSRLCSSGISRPARSRQHIVGGIPPGLRQHRPGARRSAHLSGLRSTRVSALVLSALICSCCTSPLQHICIVKLGCAR